MKSSKKLALILSCSSLSVAAQAQNPPPNSAPVLVELFTSQGCSSCPPAEDLLNTWGMDQFRKGEILPLAFHVDYWNDLGWTDPFSAPAFTARQRAYASSLHSSLYTPQLVVTGRVDLVGSDGGRARQVTDRYRGQTPVGTISLKVLSSPNDIRVNVRMSPPTKPGGSYHLYWVLFENGLSTKVESGENRGKNLEENFVVRDFGELRDGGTGGLGFKELIPWQGHWKRSRCGLGVFWQDTATLAIRGVKWIYPIQE